MKSETIGALAAALAKARLEIPNIPKNNEAKGSKFSYRYADLGTVLDLVKKPLADHGLALSQLVEGDDGKISVETLLIHDSGEFISSRITTPVASQGGRMNAMQEVGSTITYLRRYGAVALLGLAVDDDDDGHNSGASSRQSSHNGNGNGTRPSSGTGSGPGGDKDVERANKLAGFEPILTSDLLDDEARGKAKAQIAQTPTEKLDELLAAYRKKLSKLKTERESSVDSTTEQAVADVFDGKKVGEGEAESELFEDDVPYETEEPVGEDIY